MNTPRLQPVYASMNRPLTIGGAERRLFLLALVLGAATFNFFGSLLGGLLMFAALYLLARWITHADPQLLRILLRSSTSRARYDPGTLEYFRPRFENTREKRKPGPTRGSRAWVAEPGPTRGSRAWVAEAGSHARQPRVGGRLEVM